MGFTMWDALNLAVSAHYGQTDKLGKPYIHHVLAVAEGVVGFGEEATIVALLHDVVEDTDVTLEYLAEAGVKASAVEAIRLLTKQPGVPLEVYLKGITQNHTAVLVKIADNAHNTRPDRVAAITDPKTRERLAKKYTLGREILWSVAFKQEIRQIIRVVNPTLENLLEE